MTLQEIVRSFIFQRRSIRRYTSEAVSDEQIQILLEAAMAAPSANNIRPWHFVVVTDRKLLDTLADAHPYGKMLKEATLAIAVLGEVSRSPRYWVQDCSAATENLLLAAAGLGLGAVWLGVHPREERNTPVMEVLRIPDQFRVLSLVSLGNPAEVKEPRTQYEQEKICWNGW